MLRAIFRCASALVVAALVASATPAFAQSDWTGNLVGKIQAELKRHGYEMTFVGGNLNGETRDAIADWQRRQGRPATGEPSEALLEELRQSDGMVNQGTVRGPSQPGGSVAPPANNQVWPPPGQTETPPQPRTELQLPDPVSEPAPAPPPVFEAAPPPRPSSAPGPAPTSPPHRELPPIGLPPAPEGLATVLSDDFTADELDGTRWTPLAGIWRGQDGALRSSVPMRLRPVPDMYTPIMSPQERRLGLSPQAVKHTAAIASEGNIGNAFRVAMVLSGRGVSPATISIGPYLGDDAASGYRLIYDGDHQKPLKIRANEGGNITTVAAAASPVDFYDGKRHVIVWTRDIRGMMAVQIDGQAAIEPVADHSITSGFEGFSIVNQGGSWNIDSIAVQTPPHARPVETSSRSPL